MIIILSFLLGIGIGWMLKSKIGTVSEDFIKSRVKNDNLESEVKALKEQNSSQQEEVIQLREKKACLETEQSLSQKNLESVKQSMTLAFQETASSLFKESSKASQKDLSGLINPLTQEISTFLTRINAVHGENQKERAALGSELQKIHGIADNLNYVFKGNSTAQGGFGEVVLEKVLEASGLRKGEEFIVQAKALGLKNQEGDSLKPDVTVLLPDDKRIIIDSKVSLTDYYKYKDAQTDEERQKCVKGIIASISRHIANLSGKYSSLQKTPDFTLMFFPEEGAFTLALQTDKELYQKAWKEGIVITGPTTLYATLKTISFIWKTERQNKNSKEIALESGRLYDKFVGFVKDMGQIDINLDKARESCSSALNKLQSGRGNLIDKAEKIKNLGAQTDKSLPESF